jgi:hypothetical protein
LVLSDIDQCIAAFGGANHKEPTMTLQERAAALPADRAVAVFAVASLTGETFAKAALAAELSDEEAKLAADAVSKIIANDVIEVLRMMRLSAGAGVAGNC